MEKLHCFVSVPLTVLLCEYHCLCLTLRANCCCPSFFPLTQGLLFLLCTLLLCLSFTFWDPSLVWFEHLTASCLRCAQCVCEPFYAVMFTWSVCYLIPPLCFLTTGFYHLIPLPSILSVGLHYQIPLLSLCAPSCLLSLSPSLSWPCIIDWMRPNTFLSQCAHLIFCFGPHLLNVTPSPHP